MKFSECVTTNHCDQDEILHHAVSPDPRQTQPLTNFHKLVRLADRILRPLVIPRTHHDAIHPLLSENG